MIILASEDVGLADSGALGVVTDAAYALSYVGLPEAAYALTHAALYLALAPKSNSVTRAIGMARETVRARSTTEVPIHLRGTGYPGAKQLGHGDGYRYPHDAPTGVIRQQYLPDDLEDAILYRPGALGEEADLARQQRAADETLGKRTRG